MHHGIGIETPVSHHLQLGEVIIQHSDLHRKVFLHIVFLEFGVKGLHGFYFIDDDTFLDSRLILTGIHNYVKCGRIDFEIKIAGIGFCGEFTGVVDIAYGHHYSIYIFPGYGIFGIPEYLEDHIAFGHIEIHFHIVGGIHADLHHLGDVVLFLHCKCEVRREYIEFVVSGLVVDHGILVTLEDALGTVE